MSEYEFSTRRSGIPAYYLGRPNTVYINRYARRRRTTERVVPAKDVS